jgi:hypothetical protein
MAHPSLPENPGGLRARLEVARPDLLALFRSLDRMNLSAAEIPQRLLRQLFELDGDYAEALLGAGPAGRKSGPPRYAPGHPEVTGSVDARLHPVPKKLPARAHPTLEQLESRVRLALNPKEAYSMVPGRDPENV